MCVCYTRFGLGLNLLLQLVDLLLQLVDLVGEAVLRRQEVEYFLNHKVGRVFEQLRLLVHDGLGVMGQVSDLSQLRLQILQKLLLVDLLHVLVHTQSLLAPYQSTVRVHAV